MEDLETRGLTRSSEWVVVNAGEGSEIPQKKGTIKILYLRIDFFVGKTCACMEGEGWEILRIWRIRCLVLLTIRYRYA